MLLKLLKNGCHGCSRLTEAVAPALISAAVKGLHVDSIAKA